MFNFRNREQVVPGILSASAILLMVATFAYMMLVPPPAVVGTAAGHTRSRQQVESEIDQAKAHAKEAEENARSRYWTGDQDAVLAQVLALFTKQTGAYKLAMAAFRPQRSQPLGSLTEVPCSVQVTGPYPTIVTFLNSLENPETRIVVRSVQVSSSESTSGQATAVIGFSLYVMDNTATVSVQGDSHG
jgi:hypothetical protein